MRVSAGAASRTIVGNKVEQHLKIVLKVSCEGQVEPTQLRSQIKFKYVPLACQRRRKSESGREKSKRDGKDSDTVCLFACIWSTELTKISDVDFDAVKYFCMKLYLAV
jgi:hypothetical protein